jgi:hypothetical protein
VGDIPGHTDDVFIEGKSRAKPVSGDNCNKSAAAQIKTTHRQSKKNRRTDSQNETYTHHSTVIHNIESSSQPLDATGHLLKITTEQTTILTATKESRSGTTLK